MRPVIRNAASGLTLTLITVLVLLVVLEVATRIFSNIQPPLRIRDVEIGQKYLPNWSGEIYSAESELKVHVRFNGDGFRGETRPHEKPARTCRIAILGDSQIAAIATPEEKTVVAQLEGMLNRNHPEITWEVFNFGISAASTGQEIVLYQRLASKYDPDFVICVYYVGNDFADNCDRLDTNPRIYMNLSEAGDLYVEPYSAGRKRLSAWLNTHSRFYVWQKVRLRTLGHRVASSKTFFEIRTGDLIFMNKDSEDLNYAWELNEAIIKGFRDEVVNDGRRFLIAFLPSTVQLHQDIWDDFYSQDKNAQPFLERTHPNERLREIVTRNNVDHLFFQDVLEEHVAGRLHDVPEAQVLYGGIGHLNQKGSHLSAKMIYEHYLEPGVISELLVQYRE